MNLQKLTKSDEKNHLKYVQTWKSEPMIPTSTRLEKNSFQEYLKKLRKDEMGSADWVPSETYFLFLKNGEIAGAINCRYELNNFLKEVGGHIGYGVSPAYRGMGYAKKMLQEALAIYKEKGIRKVMLTVDDQNIASRKTIEFCGGIRTESGIKEDGSPYGKYWIIF